MQGPVSFTARCVATCLIGAFAGVALAQSTTFRVSDLDLRDPHLFVDFIGCFDATDAFNSELQSLLQTDGDTPPDGDLDLSYLIRFTPLDPSSATNPMQLGSSTCQPPLASPTCGPLVPSGLAGDATLSTTTACLGSVAASVSSYVPGVEVIAAPCFASPASTLTLDLGLVSIALHDAQIAATFIGHPASDLAPGLLRGFLSETDADATTIPTDVPLIGGQTLSALLPGGTGNCAAHSDMDEHEGTPGWWIYLRYTAPRITTDGAGFDGFADGFEQ